jgi:hypothetical protein
MDGASDEEEVVVLRRRVLPQPAFGEEVAPDAADDAPAEAAPRAGRLRRRGELAQAEEVRPPPLTVLWVA